MGNRVGIARHRAQVAKTSSIAVIAKAVSENAGGVGRQAAVIAAASGLVLTTGIAANAAEPTATQRDSSAASQNVAAAPTVTASASVKIAFESPSVSSAPAVVKAKPVVKVQSNTAATPVANTAVKTVAAKADANVQTAETTPPVGGSGADALIISAAFAQLGVNQDCTALASNSLAAAGIYFHGWPAGYLSLGRTVSQAEAQPGDLVYYANGGTGMAHIAVYAGNGQAVHGGWLGNKTVLASVNVGSGPVFIAIGH